MPDPDYHFVTLPFLRVSDRHISQPNMSHIPMVGYLLFRAFPRQLPAGTIVGGDCSRPRDCQTGFSIETIGISDIVACHWLPSSRTGTPAAQGASASERVRVPKGTLHFHRRPPRIQTIGYSWSGDTRIAEHRNAVCESTCARRTKPSSLDGIALYGEIIIDHNLFREIIYGFRLAAPKGRRGNIAMTTAGSTAKMMNKDEFRSLLARRPRLNVYFKHLRTTIPSRRIRAFTAYRDRTPNQFRRDRIDGYTFL